MKASPPPLENITRRFVSAQIVAALGVLLLVVFISVSTNSPIRSIFPYAFSVGLVAWKHGMQAGFLFAGLATLAAQMGGAFPSNATLAGQEVGEGLYTYLKLSAISAGVALGKRARSRQR